MTRTKKHILSNTIRTVIRGNQAVWHQLKRAIFDLGYQAEYMTTAEFLAPVERALDRLNTLSRQDLLTEWQKSHSAQTAPSESSLTSSYALLILEEIVERARIAASRTYEW